MVWIKTDDTNVINFDQITRINFTYRDDIILEFYASCEAERILIYNIKIYEDLEKMGDLNNNKNLPIHKSDMIELQNIGMLLPDKRAQILVNIAKNMIAFEYLRKILSCLAKAKDEDNNKIINIYKEFGTKKVI